MTNPHSVSRVQYSSSESIIEYSPFLQPVLASTTGAFHFEPGLPSVPALSLAAQPARSSTLQALHSTRRRRNALQRDEEEGALQELADALALDIERADDEQSAEHTTAVGRQRTKRVKLLKASTAKIEQLQSLVTRLSDTLHSQDKHVLNLSQHVKSLAMTIASSGRAPAQPNLSFAGAYLPSSSSSSSCPSSALSLASPHNLDAGLSYFNDRFVLMLLDVTAGCVRDVNAAFHNTSGFTPQEVQLALGQPHRTLICPLAERGHLPTFCFVAASLRRQTALMLEDGLGLEEAPLDEEVEQYPSTLKEVGELLRGERRSCQSVWRCLFADGHMYEVEALIFVLSGEVVEDADTGRRYERPLTVMFSAGYSAPVQMPCKNRACTPPLE